MRLKTYITKRPNGRWRAVYDDPVTGREVTRHFSRKIDAEQWLDTIRAEVTLGTYIDPRAGRVTFGEYAWNWHRMQMHRPTTTEALNTYLRRYMLPTFGDRRLDAIKPSDVQAWVKRLSASLAPTTVKTVYTWFAGIMLAAQHDGFIRQSPCRRIALPKVERGHGLVPISAEDVARIVNAMPEPVAQMALIGALTGMRQGEVFGLTWESIDFLRRVLRVERQLVNGVLSAPKSSSSYRSIPLTDTALRTLSTMPRTHDLVFLNNGQPWQRNRFSHVWRPVVQRLGMDVTFHDLRHFYASALIAQGCSVKTVQRCLGHASATITLDTYGHLWPDSEDQVRSAIDAVLAADSLADYSTKQASDQA